MGSDLPTIEFVGADGIRREHDYQRAPHAPWNAPSSSANRWTARCATSGPSAYASSASTASP